MKTVTMEEFRAHVDRYLGEAEREIVVVTRDDKPCVQLQPVPSRADTDADELTRSPEFWRIIQDRRKETPVPWDEAKKDLALE